MQEIKALLLDWRGTMVADPEDDWWVTRAYERLGRTATAEDVRRAVEGLAAASELEEVRVLWQRADCSAELHRSAARRYFDLAGLDAELSNALYQLDFDRDSHPLGVEVRDILRRVKARGARIAVVCDIHFDLRPEFQAHGLDELIDAFVLSFEHNVQKPDALMFRMALEALDAQPGDALMVGDRPGRDGGAVQVGITTLLAPTRRRADDKRLDRVAPLVGR